ncbi:hypothetical protein MES5069_260004 [Mesorhizobium escarrei]|uniref:Transposase n=1 Tax=Mesorhizobium escarrei TaxID=666018 RepID=A0ABM9DV79_9HYPH|nr:hypothetical protein MES5069_260004 [Mesorhizobium escarrei]
MQDGANITASHFSPFTGRNARQGNEGQRRLQQVDLQYKLGTIICLKSGLTMAAFCWASRGRAEELQ